MFSDFGYGNGGGILTAEYKVAAERESAFFFSFLFFSSFPFLQLVVKACRCYDGNTLGY
jgi:hypothetical protein